MMNLKRILAFVLSVCMVLSLAPVSTIAFAEENETAETPAQVELEVEQLDGEKLDADLTQAAVDSDIETLDPMISENETVKVLIVMEGESVIEEDPTAVVSEETDAKVEELEEAQAQVVEEIERTVLDGEKLDVSYSYTWLLNGVAAEIPYGSIKEILAIDGVKQVLIQPIYEVCETEIADPNTITDGVMVGRESTWGAGYTGEGMKIAIVDTGLDIDHQNFAALSEDKLTDTSATADTVEAVLSSLNATKRYSGELTIDDVYYNTKVAYGFNYCDDDLDITHDYDGVSAHGTHVAGIAAANKVDGSDVVGVAPDAQLYVMKVFGKNGGAYTEDILAALEDALMLGADVVNMSLGSPAGFTSASDEIDAIYNRVSQTNTVLSVSAGNNYTAGYANSWGYNLSTTENPDNAVIGQPALYNNVMSVASVENWKVQRNYIQVSDGYKIGYIDQADYSETPAVTTLDGAYGIVVIPGYGAEEDYEGLDVNGKVALVVRGNINFSVKVDNAYNHGAVACIVYNNTSGEFAMDLSACESSYPVATITMADGAYLANALAENPELTISFPEDLAGIPNEDAYEISDFSSWGVGPDLSLEPDIAAPGGYIYSTINDGEYGLMSGTSMAAPNVAGLSALVMEYVKETFPEEENARGLVQNLLMSTSVPLPYGGDTGLYYSPRQEGSGLANAFNAVSTQAYLTVDGMDVPKVELYDDDDRTGAYNFSFKVHNFGDGKAFYALNTVIQTETPANGGDGNYYMYGVPMGLSGVTAENSNALVLTYDVDDTGVTNSHDAYIIYRATQGDKLDSYVSEEFRYDADCSGEVDTTDVQAYLDALVGNDSAADLADESLCVLPGETAVVNVSVAVDEADLEVLDVYFPNGIYVEGYTFLDARNAGGVDLSLPYLAFYGDWDDAPILDNGYYYDVYNSDGTYNQYITALYTLVGGNYAYPGMNIYVEGEVIDPAHISLSPNGDGYFDSVDDMYVSLLRNASMLTYSFTNVTDPENPVELYTLEVSNASKSVYSDYYGQIIPEVYSWYGVPAFDWKNEDGSDLENNDVIRLDVSATGAYEGAHTDTWSVPISIDLEAPELLSATKTTDENGKVTLELSFRDNLSCSVVVLTDMFMNNIYAMEGVEDVAEDENGYQNYTQSFDITGLTGKLVIVLSDYALNESYYALNLGGENADYGELVAYSFNPDTYNTGWVSFDHDVNLDEVPLYNGDGSIVCAEYVNGYVFAQDETGALYGFKYEDMLKETFDLETTYVAQLDNVYQDLAYSYAEGKLLGLYAYVDDGYPTSEIYSINLKGAYFDEDNWEDVAAYQEDWLANRGGVYGLTLAVDDAGTLYVLGTNYDWDTEALTEEAYLWAAERVVNSDRWGSYVDYTFQNMGSTGKSMNYLQSMTWDHNTEELYWARFDGNAVSYVSELYEITLQQNAEGETGVYLEKVGNLSGETWAMFAPLSDESAIKEEHLNIPEMDPSVIGTPILREDTVTMNVTGTKKLSYDLDPWYTDYKEVVWSSSDESVVTVSENGVINCIAQGSAVITVANAADENLSDSLTVEVTALDLSLKGIITAQEAGLGNVTGTSTYEFNMVQGISSFGTVNAITASDELNHGLSLATSAMGRGSIWAVEYGNTGMVYQINAETGEVVDVLQPIDGDMLLGMTYSEELGTFAGIMDMYLYVDLELTHEEQQKMLDSYDEDLNEFTYHKANLLPYLQASGGNFVTGENGNGASSEIVFCGITTLPGGYYFEDTYKDYTGSWDSTGNTVTYIADQTLLLMDNVGRLWYIDEVTGMTKVTEDEYGNVEYANEDYSAYITCYGQFRDGVFAVETGDDVYSLFNIRCIDETDLTDMFRDGTMPRITYHFSDIEYAGDTADGAPMIIMSLYDYWNNGTTNELYLYIPGVGTGEWVMDYETWVSYEVTTPTRLYSLGTTGENNIIATVHEAEVTGGVDPVSSEEELTEQTMEELGVNTLAIGAYTAE